jgi:allophanate hydrolase
MNPLPSLPVRSLAIHDLQAAYRHGGLKPLALIEALWKRLEVTADRGIWITLLPPEQIFAQARALAEQDPHSLPLYGVPFAIKDNIDLAGCPTSAGCPAFSYTPTQSSPVVARLMAAGAVPIGKTNLDQFATGLVGTRSPYGVCRNSFNPDYISGGSSAGSAVAVALGLASFALGSDTAGSGRVPAAFNNLIGLKPSLGRLSARGMVPACRTLDCLSIFTLDAEDAARVCRVAEGFDPEDPYSRAVPAPERLALAGSGAFRFGVPQADQLKTFGNGETAGLFERAAFRMEQLGGQRVTIDYAPFAETARLLYEGPWLAERYLVAQALLERTPEALFPVTRQIIEGGRGLTAAQSFAAQYRLAALARSTEPVWAQIDVLLTPTAGTIYRIDEVEADPIQLNSNLGYYTNFMNLLGLAGVAVPAGFMDSGMPFGVTLAAPAGSDYELLALASRLQRAGSARLGALELPLAANADFSWAAQVQGIDLAVCGAHLEGLTLNHQLRDRGAVLMERTRTAPVYRLYALPGGPPFRPGLVRVAEHGAAIEVEVWRLPAAALGSFVTNIPAPLGIGKLLLADQRQVSGFICEGLAIEGARDITALGGWRAYLAQPSAAP